VRILHVITLGELGGAQRYVAELALRQRACDDVVEVAAGTTDWLDDQRDSFSLVHSIPGLRRQISPAADLRALGALIELIGAGRFDVVHTHSAKAGILGRVAAALRRVPIVAHTSHGTVLAEKLSGRRRAVYWSAERLATSLTHKLFAVSETERGVLERSLGAPGHSIRVMTLVPRYIRAITARWSPTLGCPSDLVAIGNLYSTKGYDVLLQSVKQLSDRHPDIRLTIYGEGPARSALEAQAARLEIGERVAFAGHTSDAPARLASAGIFVMPSRKEGLPLALLEAMATAVPIVATNVGAIGEAIGPDVALARAEDPSDLAEKMELLLGSDRARVSAAASARKSYERLEARDDPRGACTMYQG
jgi:glycosyltransferase involved in cell wall biosynthesis